MKIKNVKESLKKEEFGDVKQNKDDHETCPICLEEYKEKDKVATIQQCKHMFHEECISAWLETGNFKCPLCNFELSPEVYNQRLAVAEGNLYDSDDEDDEENEDRVIGVFANV